MRLILFISSLCLSGSLFAQLTPSYNMTKRYSVRELEQWLKKNNRPRFVNPADFNISVQVNAGWTNTHNTRGGVSRVGRGTGTASNSFSPNVNIDFKYYYGRAWIGARTSYRNTGGLFNGTANSFGLNRAHIGYHLTTHGPVICDVTIGRRALTKIYNSQLQFKGDADGATLISSYILKNVVDLRAAIGAYIQGDRTYWILRGELFNIANLGLYFDYSLAHWGNIRPNTFTNGIDVKFNTSQFLLGWDFKPKWLKKDLKFFAALLTNHGATVNRLTNGSKLRNAGYVGMQFGNVKKKNDFSVQGQLQFCGLQAVAPWSLLGIGTGSRTGALFTATNFAIVNDTTNFKGWEAVANYAISDELTLTAKIQRSVPANKNIGRDYNFTSFKLETQYTY